MKKYPIRFIHASDLHLDAVFPGLSKEVPPDLRRQLHQATFIALERLIGICIEKQPDFLLLSGDIYNEENHSIAAILALRDGCLTLEKAGISVYIVHGNHDPFSSRLHSVTWPKNVTIFGTELTNVPFTARDGTLLARVYGISHATNRESKNLAVQFKKTEDPCLHIAMLHCTVGESNKADRYAPCSIKDFVTSDMDYWALGHIHEYQQISQNPLAIYPGCTQGLHINEQGEKGCVLVTAEPQGLGYTLHPQFYTLSPVLWHILTIDLDEKTLLLPSENQTDSLNNLEQTILTELDKLTMSFSPGWQTLIIRIILTGQTSLDTLLRQGNNLDDFLERLRQLTEEQHLWIKDLILQTTPPICIQDFIEREDLLGEIIRLSKSIDLSESTEQLPQKALAPLFSHHKLRKVLNYPDQTELKQCLLDAELLCIELLEND